MPVKVIVALVSLLAACAPVFKPTSTVQVSVYCGTQAARGGGFAVSNRHVITAKHVIKCEDRIYVKDYFQSKWEVVVDAVSKDDVARLVVTGVDEPFKDVVTTTNDYREGTRVCILSPHRGWKQVCGRITNIMDNRLELSIVGHLGDSGSPVFNVDGQVIGVVVSKTEYKTYAVPLDVWRNLLPESMPELE